MITEITSGEYKGLWSDNITKQFVTRETVDKMGYTIQFPYFFPLRTIKIIIGYTLGSVGKLIRKFID